MKSSPSIYESLNHSAGIPGIDIGIPTGKNSRQASPEDTYAATRAALEAGAHGVLFSRKYSEMKLANLEAAGKAVLDVG